MVLRLQTTAHDFEEVFPLRLPLVPATFRATQLMVPERLETLREAFGAVETFTGAESEEVGDSPGSHDRCHTDVGVVHHPIVLPGLDVDEEVVTVAHLVRRAMPSRLVSSMADSYAATREAIESGLSRSTSSRSFSGDAPASR